MYTITLDDFDLEQIMNSGQVFRMYCLGQGRYCVKAGQRYLELEQSGNRISFDCDEEEYREYWYDYFDISRNYAGLKANVGTDDVFLSAAVNSCGGIRILRQELWEMIVTFIISQQKQIPSIRKCVEALCARYGKHFVKNGREWYGFPNAGTIAAGGPGGLDGLSLGYRARYIYETSVQFAGNPVTRKELGSLTYDDAMLHLKTYCGVGEKVANCICLFGLGMVDAFPIDVHIKDILYREYYRGELAREGLTDRDYIKLVDDFFSRFSGYRGIIQQWIFAYEIKQKSS